MGSIGGDWQPTSAKPVCPPWIYLYIPRVDTKKPTKNASQLVNIRPGVSASNK